MAKNTFLSFDTTASNNTDIAGIDIQGTAAVMNFDNAFRQLMAILRTDLDNGQVFVTKAAGYTALAADNNAFYEFTAAATLALTAAATLAADWHMMVFANGGAVTIDPDGAELINGAATLVVADGDAAYIICTGSAFKAVVIPSTALIQPYVDVASDTTTDIGAATSQNVRITGTTTITGLGTAAAGTVRDVIFADSLILTYNGTSVILQNGGRNIVTAAGDGMRFVSLGSGNWRQTDWQRANNSTINEMGAQTATGVETALNFTSIPAGVKRITVSFVSFSTNGTSNPVVQLSTGSTFATSGYLGSASNITSGVSTGNDGAGFRLQNSVTAATTFHGVMILLKTSGDTWSIVSGGGMSDTTFSAVTGASKVLGGTLDGVRVTTEGGANTIDSGSIVNVFYEY